MNEANRDFLPALIERVEELLADRPAPVVIALDGPSGAGKSTLASSLKEELGAVVIPLDDFFAANIPDHKWDEFSIEEKLEFVLHWDRVRTEVIEPLRQGNPARWHSFDFAFGLQADGTYAMEKEAKERQPDRVIVIEGAYSSSPELVDLVDFTILMNVPLKERRARLEARENHDFLEKWHHRWDDVEEYYFNAIRPQRSFDLIIEGT